MDLRITPLTQRISVADCEAFDRAGTLERLRNARNRFWFSLGGYALLTEDPARSAVADFTMTLDSEGIHLFPKNIVPASRGLDYRLSFDAPIDIASARAVIESVFRAMIIDSYEATNRYASENGLVDALKQQDWYQVARYLRHAFSHDGTWRLTDTAQLPASWRHLTIDAAMNGKSVDGFLGWYDGLQLCAGMQLFVGVT